MIIEQAKVDEPVTGSVEKAKREPSRDSKITYEEHIKQLRELVESHADVECEYCLLSIEDSVLILRHGLEPAVDGRHRVIHTLAGESGKYVPCRRSKAETKSAEYTKSVWHERYAATEPARL